MEENNMNQNNTEQSNASPNNNSKKPIYKRPWFIAIAIIFAFGIICGACDDETKNNSDSSTVAEVSTESSIEEKTEPPTEAETEPPTKKPTEEETEPPTEKPTETENEEDDEGFIEGAKKFLFGNEEDDGVVDKIKDGVNDFLSDEEIEVKNPDEIIIDGTSYSINDLSMEQAKELVPNAKEEELPYDDLIMLQNDDLAIAIDPYLGDVWFVSFLSSGNKICNDVEVGMSKRKVIEKYGSPITLDEDEKQLLWYFDSEGQQPFSMKNAVCFILVTTDWLNNVESITIANETVCHLYSDRYGW